LASSSVRAPEASAFLDQHHRGHRHDRLGHRIDAKQIVALHRRAVARATFPDRLVVHHLAATRDQHHGAGNVLRGDFGPQPCANPVQAFSRHPRLRGIRDRQALRLQCA
jgi:hypothetical protein